jgi:hypothetical protein
MAKDDIVVGLGRPMYGTSALLNRKKAYPSVVTTIVQMSPQTRKFLALHNFLCTHSNSARKLQKKFLEAFCSDSALPVTHVAHDARVAMSLDEAQRKTLRFQIKNMLEFYVVGVSLGTAWAHPSSGDTVASVMIGGLRTVLVGFIFGELFAMLCLVFFIFPDL